MLYINYLYLIYYFFLSFFPQLPAVDDVLPHHLAPSINTAPLPRNFRLKSESITLGLYLYSSIM